MGKCKVGVFFGNAGDGAGETPPGRSVRGVLTDAILDNGDVLTLVTQEHVNNLGLRSLGTVNVTLADNRKVAMERAGPLSVTILGRTCTTDCLVGPAGCAPILGQIVLRSLDLVFDPVDQTLAVRPESPFLPTIKMKSLPMAA